MRIRNNKDSIMSDIIETYERKNPKEKGFRRRFAIRVNTLKWSNQDLHYVYNQVYERANWSKWLNYQLKIGL